MYMYTFDVRVVDTASTVLWVRIRVQLMSQCEANDCTEEATTTVIRKPTQPDAITALCTRCAAFHYEHDPNIIRLINDKRR